MTLMKKIILTAFIDDTHKLILCRAHVRHDAIDFTNYERSQIISIVHTKGKHFSSHIQPSK